MVPKNILMSVLFRKGQHTKNFILHRVNINRLLQILTSWLHITLLGFYFLSSSLYWSSLTPMTFVAKTFEAGPLRPVRGCDDWRQRYLTTIRQVTFDIIRNCDVGEWMNEYLPWTKYLHKNYLATALYMYSTYYNEWSCYMYVLSWLSTSLCDVIRHLVCTDVVAT